MADRLFAENIQAGYTAKQLEELKATIPGFDLDATYWCRNKYGRLIEVTGMVWLEMAGRGDARGELFKENPDQLNLNLASENDRDSETPIKLE